MPIAFPQPALQHSSSRAVFAGCLLMIAMLFGLGWRFSVESRRVQQAQTKWNADKRAFFKVQEAEQTRMSTQLRPWLGKPGSRQQIEALLNHGQPFVTYTKDGSEVADWEDPSYSIGIEFQFRGDEVAGWRGPFSKEGSAVVRWDQRFFPIASPKNEALRSWIATIGVFTWVIALVIWLQFNAQRLNAALAMLLGSLACGTAWLHYPFFTRWIIQDDGLFPAAIMLFLSIYLLSATLVELKAHGVLLPRIRFRLREILLGIAVISFVLFTGPFGYLALLVALGGSLIFAITNLVHRRWNPFRTREALA